MMQGRCLTETLHSLSLCVIGLYGSELSGDERDRLTASHNGHLKTMWEANCSCRSAGYPEGDVMELSQTWGEDGSCSGLPSPMDVPTMSQAAARQSAAEILRSLRQLAGRARPEPSSEGGDGKVCGRVPPHQPDPSAVGEDNNSIFDPASYAGWEALQTELLTPAPSEVGVPSSCSWGKALWCFNPACTNLEGPSDLALKTLPCGGGCGVRYCSPECQAQGWRDGHRLSCGRLRDRRVARVVDI